MTMRQSLLRAARSLEKWAEIIRSSETIGVIGHPRRGMFDNDEQGRADQKEYENMMADAKTLRALAKK